MKRIHCYSCGYNILMFGYYSFYLQLYAYENNTPLIQTFVSKNHENAVHTDKLLWQTKLVLKYEVFLPNNYSVVYQRKKNNGNCDAVHSSKLPLQTKLLKVYKCSSQTITGQFVIYRNLRSTAKLPWGAQTDWHWQPSTNIC